jgi:Zn-dependent protease with chaperone function
MNRTVPLLLVLLVVVGTRAHLWAADGPREYKHPAYVTPFDLATPEDTLLGHQLDSYVQGSSPKNWLLLKDLAPQLGDWVTKYLDAQRIAAEITDSLQIGGQPVLKDVDELVTDCAAILHVNPPVVLVRNSPMARAYVVEANDQRFLVLTSALLNLYEGKPEELRFIIGRELTHVKAGHLQLRSASYALLSLLTQVDIKVVPDQFQNALPTLAMGRFCSWSREAEITADKGGLLCCQDPQVAYNALARLLSGVSAKSSWVNPNAPDFDADRIVKSFERWQDQPFVKFILYIKSFSRDSPYVPERLAALKQWSASERYQDIFSRTWNRADPNADQLVVVKMIKAAELAGEESTVHPYVKVYDGPKELFRTPYAKNTRSATWSGIDYSFQCSDRQPVFCEIWSRGYVSDTFIGGFVVYPVNPANDRENGRTVYTAPIDWNWKNRTHTARNGLAEMTVEFQKRAKE